MKRIFDVFVSFSMIILLGIPIIIVAIAIKVSMGSPVMFKQIRPGIKGAPFYIKKFRTMTNEKNKAGELLPNKERITKVGLIIRKLSLDELPQLFNVIKGEMSFVGPRPLLMEYLPLYNEEQMKRHDVLPGITGWAQVNGRNNISWEDRFKLDLYYVENQTIWLDIKILFLTVLKVFRRADVTPEGKEFIEKFKGNNRND